MQLVDLKNRTKGHLRGPIGLNNPLATTINPQPAPVSWPFNLRTLSLATSPPAFFSSAHCAL